MYQSSLNELFFLFSNYYNVELNKYKVRTGTSLRFWKNKDWINKIDPYEWFNVISDTFWEEDLQVI